MDTVMINHLDSDSLANLSIGQTNKYLLQQLIFCACESLILK